jgi:hypothetical protein
VTASFVFAVVIEDKSPDLAFMAAKSNPLTAEMLLTRTNFKFLDNWVVFPFDRMAMTRARGVLCGPPSHFNKLIHERMTAEALSDTCWALKIQPLVKGNSRIIFFARGPQVSGRLPTTIGPVNVYIQKPNGDAFGDEEYLGV